jgi:hypothetical protein
VLQAAFGLLSQDKAIADEGSTKLRSHRGESRKLTACDRLGIDGAADSGIYRRRFWCEESFRDQKQEFEIERVRVTKAARLENLLLGLAIVLMMLAVIGLRGNELGRGDKYCTRKKKRVVLSWVQVALKMLRESARFLNLLVESQGTGFYFRWA